MANTCFFGISSHGVFDGNNFTVPPNTRIILMGHSRLMRKLDSDIPFYRILTNDNVQYWNRNPFSSLPFNINVIDGNVLNRNICPDMFLTPDIPAKPTSTIQLFRSGIFDHNITFRYNDRNYNSTDIYNQFSDTRSYFTQFRNALVYIQPSLDHNHNMMNGFVDHIPTNGTTLSTIINNIPCTSGATHRTFFVFACTSSVTNTDTYGIPSKQYFGTISNETFLSKIAIIYRNNKLIAKKICDYNTQILPQIYLDFHGKWGNYYQLVKCTHHEHNNKFIMQPPPSAPPPSTSPSYAPPPSASPLPPPHPLYSPPAPPPRPLPPPPSYAALPAPYPGVLHVVPPGVPPGAPSRPCCSNNCGRYKTRGGKGGWCCAKCPGPSGDQTKHDASCDPTPCTPNKTQYGAITNCNNFYDPNNTICFYNSGEPYYEFTNFWAAPLSINGLHYPTSEHYFQAMKFYGTDPTRFHEVRKLASPKDAFNYVRNPLNVLYIRPDWENVKYRVMNFVVYQKFIQHKDLQDLLLSTGDKIIVEHTTYDTVWADGGRPNYGNNWLGVILMNTRNRIRTHGPSPDEVQQYISPPPPPPQSGGTNSNYNDLYKQKYLKYKQKYTELKNK